MSFERLGVIGGGAWGTALAQVGASGGRHVLLWAREPEVVEALNGEHENKLFLSGHRLEPTVRATTELADLAECDAWLVVTPAQHMRSVLEAAPRCEKPLILCSKGIEERSGSLLHHAAAEACPGASIAVLSGPTFAHEVASGLPTAVTLAAKDEALASSLVQALGSATFRPYHTTDVRGVEIGGAAKNVLAIAVGIAVGRKLGASAQAALTTRGFAELTRLGRALGARRETLTGLSGLGDLILTCASPQSRNFALGLALGRGEQPPAGKLAEGEFTAPVLIELAASKGIELPVSEAVASILSGRSTIDAAISALMTRPFKSEE